ncbi:CD209 antigen-like [Clinocottus analis]|uniref:CD209 antigen-like n=1 Tax=Clinocottus analis TaxID=304258 RepID=UPI0035C08B30
MEDIYANIEYDKSKVSFRPSAPHTGGSSSQSRSHGAAALSLGLLSALLLAGLVGLGVHSRGSAADLSTIKNNLTSMTKERDSLTSNLTQVSDERDRLTSNLTQVSEERDRLTSSLTQVSEERDRLTSSLTQVSEERDRLTSSLTQVSEERDRLQRWSKLKKTCPAGWKRFSCSCYFLSSRSDTWEQSREDCKDRGADLVIIDSLEEQKFLSSIAEHRTWIGLTDRDDEGSWKWIDGTPLTQAYWGQQPDNGGGDPQYGEEDCAEIVNSWKAEVESQ